MALRRSGYLLRLVVVPLLRAGYLLRLVVLRWTGCLLPLGLVAVPLLRLLLVRTLRPLLPN